MHPHYPLVLLANRDEFYARPSRRAQWWLETPGILAGKDLQGGGTWMGLNRHGAFAALTNIREPDAFDPKACTRGELVIDWLKSSGDPPSYLKSVDSRADSYNGFNLLLGDASTVWHYDNRQRQPRSLGPGIYGLSNAVLDTAWPKLEAGKAELAQALHKERLDQEALFDILLNEELAPDEFLPSTGVSLEWERLLSARFIKSPEYGTRVSSLLLMHREKPVYFEERAFVPSGPPRSFSLNPMLANQFKP